MRRRVAAAIKALFDLDLAEAPIEVPPNTALGDLAVPVAFELAKQLKARTGEKQNPRELASRLADEIRGADGVERVDVAGPGYLNIYLDRAAYLLNAAREPGRLSPRLGGKIIVEHTSVNPNKAAHIGHLRNAVLGDTIARLLRCAGEQVEVQNYIDNTGVQVADVVVGFKYIEDKTLDQVKEIEGRFDYYCWDLYAQVGAFYEQDKSRLQLRTQVLHDIESAHGEVYAMADYVSTRVLARHLETMLRVGVQYEVLPRESDVLHMDLWKRTFELLKQHGGVEFETTGKLAGCWVMRAPDDPTEAGSENEYEMDKVIVRSNGTVTYTGKDIAVHLWKLGQLGLDFYYNQFFPYPDGAAAWISSSNPGDNDPRHPAFGNGAVYFNVIDIGQAYPQHYVKLGVMLVDQDQRAQQSAHLAYEKVVLTPAAAEQLGQRLSDEDRERGLVSMSGRKGLGVKVDDLIDQLEVSALAEVVKRHAELSPTDQVETAHKIAIGALRYFLLKYTRTSIISFDFKEALAFDGETGPYIQYGVVRANSIFKKLAEAGIETTPDALSAVTPQQINDMLKGEAGDDLWSLAYFATRLPDVVRAAVTALEPAIAAKWVFQLAQRFNSFYHTHRVVQESDPARRSLLVAITAIVRRQLIAALGVLGIEAPEQM